jgi:hypothetical protein
MINKHRSIWRDLFMLRFLFYYQEYYKLYIKKRIKHSKVEMSWRYRDPRPVGYQQFQARNQHSSTLPIQLHSLAPPCRDCALDRALFYTWLFSIKEKKTFPPINTRWYSQASPHSPSKSHSFYLFEKVTRFSQWKREYINRRVKKHLYLLQALGTLHHGAASGHSPLSNEMTSSICHVIRFSWYVDLLSYMWSHHVLTTEYV